MKLVQIGAFAAALMMSSLVMAAGGGDRTFARMMAANDRTMALVVAKEQARDPVAVNEKKGEKSKDL